MTQHPTDDELEAMAQWVEHHAEYSEALDTAAMLRACKGRVKPTLADLRPIWKRHGGDWHGPRVERWTIPEANVEAFFKDVLSSLDPAPNHSDWNAAIEAVGLLRGRDVQKRDAEDVGEAYDLAIDEAQDAIRAALRDMKGGK